MQKVIATILHLSLICNIVVLPKSLRGCSRLQFIISSAIKLIAGPCTWPCSKRSFNIHTNFVLIRETFLPRFYVNYNAIHLKLLPLQYRSESHGVLIFTASSINRKIQLDLTLFYSMSRLPDEWEKRLPSQVVNHSDVTQNGFQLRGVKQKPI